VSAANNLKSVADVLLHWSFRPSGFQSLKVLTGLTYARQTWRRNLTITGIVMLYVTSFFRQPAPLLHNDVVVTLYSDANEAA
jgi:hypothetical protein